MTDFEVFAFRRNFVFKIIRRTERVPRRLPGSEEVSERAQLPRSARQLLRQPVEVCSAHLRRLPRSARRPLLPRQGSERHPRLEVVCSAAAGRARSVSPRLRSPRLEEVSSGRRLRSRLLEGSLARRRAPEASDSRQHPRRRLRLEASEPPRTSLRRRDSRSVARRTRRLPRAREEDCSVRPPPRRVNLQTRSVSPLHPQREAVCSVLPNLPHRLLRHSVLVRHSAVLREIRANKLTLLPELIRREREQASFRIGRSRDFGTCVRCSRSRDS